TTVRRLMANKAPGADAIPIEMLRLTLPAIINVLLWIFNKCIETGYHPKDFNENEIVTVALKKLGGKDCSQVTSYCPIALLNTSGKVLEAILATRLSALIESEHLLLKNHLG
ncbi:hypothetical protein BDZ45DRAFT_547727, partial [Acephala macrosclerotiorum]